MRVIDTVLLYQADGFAEGVQERFVAVYAAPETMFLLCEQGRSPGSEVVIIFYRIYGFG